MKISIIIPAHNEENRIERTVRAYYQFFTKKNISFELVIVLNGCTDKTFDVIERVRNDLNDHLIIILDLEQAGKGFAIKAGFANALTRDNDLIGFVDADMATAPDAFYDLVTNIGNNDGVIASRYIPGAQIYPPRPAYKRYGSRIIYEPFVWLLFGLSYYDLQCGAKLFKRAVLEHINSQLTVTQWAFDVELLYLCKKSHYTIREIPTTWHDQADSKLTLRGGLRMFSALLKVWWQHQFFN
ncbi:MAG TPA: glycosyltransferase [Candidatus Babeliales bacterium]|nr:glycosyltransferase [Candidatus Babeliales bacterium]